ncbi:MAG: DUF4198 domain-containing protein [Gammaproteobacteria bacterium]
MPRASVLACFALGLVGASCAAEAHSPYLLPNAFDLVDRNHVTVEASFTETFFVPDVVMKADDYHVIAPDGARQTLTPVYTQDLAIIEAPTPTPGTYRISTGQRSGRTSKAIFRDGDYEFVEPGKSPPANTRVYDVKSVTTAEVYVTRGKPTDVALAARNKGLEFRALSHPNSLFAGQEAKFEVLFDGRALANQVIFVHFDDERYSDKKLYAQVKTDVAGRFSVKLERPGIYLAMTRHRLLPARRRRAWHQPHVFSHLRSYGIREVSRMKPGLLAACLLVVSPAIATAASHDIKIFITEHDLNHDGSVSKEEFADERERLFIATDANHDGGLSHDEYVGEYHARLLLQHRTRKPRSGR